MWSGTKRSGERVKVLGELGDTAQIGVKGVGRVVADLQVFEHALPKGGHRGG